MIRCSPDYKAQRLVGKGLTASREAIFGMVEVSAMPKISHSRLSVCKETRHTYSWKHCGSIRDWHDVSRNMCTTFPFLHSHKVSFPNHVLVWIAQCLVVKAIVAARSSHPTSRWHLRTILGITAMKSATAWTNTSASADDAHFIVVVPFFCR